MLAHRQNIPHASDASLVRQQQASVRTTLTKRGLSGASSTLNPLAKEAHHAAVVPASVPHSDSRRQQPRKINAPHACLFPHLQATQAPPALSQNYGTLAPCPFVPHPPHIFGFSVLSATRRRPPLPPFLPAAGPPAPVPALESIIDIDDAFDGARKVLLLYAAPFSLLSSPSSPSSYWCSWPTGTSR